MEGPGLKYDLDPKIISETSNQTFDCRQMIEVGCDCVKNCVKLWPHVTKDCVRASLEPNAGSERNSRGSSRLALEAVGPC